MKSKVIIILRILFKLMRLMVYGFLGILALAVIGVFFGGQYQNGNFIIDYDNIVMKVPVIYPLLTLVIIMVMCGLVLRMLYDWDRLLSDIKQDRYFSVGSGKRLTESLILLVCFTVLQLVIGGTFAYLHISSVSGLFTFFFEHYYVNAIFFLIHVYALSVFKKGMICRKSSLEEITHE